MPSEVNFYDPRTPPALVKDMLSGWNGAITGEVKEIQPGWTLAHVMHAAGLFPSVGQAKKNGWNRPIPDGWSEYTVGKLNTRIYIVGYVEPCRSVCHDCKEGCVFLA
jgi:hypothetical protein